MQRKSIAGAIRLAAQGDPATAPVLAPEKATSGPKIYHAASRAGKKMVAAPVDPAAHRQLKILAAETGITTEELIRQGIRLMFAEHGKPPIA